MEYRLYNRPDSSIFDLISGDRETKQSKGLGLLLAKSTDIMNSVLRLIFKKVRCNTQYALKSLSGMVYIVDCEMSTPNNKTSGRADIVIRFYSNNKTPAFAIVIEAKSIQRAIHNNKALSQAASYANNLPQLKPFGNNVLVGSLTLFLSIHSTSSKNTFYLSWMEIIQLLETTGKKVKNHLERELIDSFRDFLIKTNNIMNHYSVEVMSIPGRVTAIAANDPNCGIYECPLTKEYSKYSKQKPIFIAFREKGGVIRSLHKLAGIEVLDINDDVKINTIDETGRYPDFAKRIKQYKSHFPAVNGVKQVFVMDLSESITLPYTVKYKKRSPQGLAYHDIKEFFPSSLCQTVVLLNPKKQKP